MRILLHVVAGQQPAYNFEHAGPTIRMGRDPTAELSFQGAASSGVSFHHAQVELTSSGAFLTDQGSSNGTLLNEQQVTSRVSVGRGDQVRLGFTGPLLRITELDLGPLPTHRPQAPAPIRPPAPAPTRPAKPALPGRPSRPVAASSTAEAAVRRLQTSDLIGFGLVGVLVAGLVCFLLLRKSDTPVAEAPPPTQPATSPQTEAIRAAPTARTVLPNPPEKQPPVRPEPPVRPREGLEERFLGHYVNDEKKRPNVLLMRQGDPHPWGRLKPGSGVPAANYLLSLPGYRSEIALATRVYLTLWGNLPEFSLAPMLESVAILNVPEAGFDLDLTLDRGRIHLANVKSSGPVRARIRFLQEVWDVTLPDGKSEAALELGSFYSLGVPFSKEPGGNGPSSALALLVRGSAELSVRNRKWQLPDAGLMLWSNEGANASRAPEPQGPKKLPQLPDWWTDKLEVKKDQRRDEALLAMKDLSENLHKDPAGDVVDVLRTQVREARELDRRSNRALGVLCLGAVDALPLVVEALEDPVNTEVRGTAIRALQHWIGRSADHDASLYTRLQTECRYPPARAEKVCQLLHTFSRKEIEDGKAQESLVADLEHENLAVRVLAYWHLQFLLSQGVEYGYEPAGEADLRKQAVERWRKLLRSKK